MNKLSKEIINKKITYKELCYLFDEKTRTDSRKKSKQLEKFSHYCNFNIEGKGRGTKYIITEIYETPKEIKETRGGANNHSNKYQSLEDQLMLTIANNLSKNDIVAYEDRNKKFGKPSAQEPSLTLGKDKSYCYVYMYGIDLYEQLCMVNSKYRENKYNHDIISIKNKMSENFTPKDYKEKVWDGRGDALVKYNEYMTRQAELFSEDFYMQFKKRECDILNKALNKLAQKRLIHKDYCYCVVYQREVVDKEGNLMYDDLGNIVYETIEEYTDIKKTSDIENAQAEVLNNWDLDDEGNKKFKTVSDVPSYLYPKLNRDALAILNKDTLEIQKETGEYLWKIKSYYRAYKIYVFDVALERFVRLSKQPKLEKEEDYNMKNINNIVTLAVANTLSNACEKAKRGEIQKGKSRFLDVRANNKKLYVEFVKENCSICEFLTDETIDKLIELSRD